MSQNPEGPPESEVSGFSLQVEIAKVRAGGKSDHFIVNYLAGRDPNELGILTTAFNEVTGGLRESEWMKIAADQAGMVFKPVLNEEGIQTGLRLIPKPTSTPQIANPEIPR